MNFRKTLAMLIIGALMAVGLATPAKAAYADCYNYPGTVCLTAGSNWGGPVWRQYPDQINGCRALTGFNDVTTTVRNGSNDGILILWQHYDCTGASYQLGGLSYADMTGYWWDNKASAVEYILV